MSPEIEAIHAAANRARAQYGLSALRLDDSLCAQSQRWTDHMAATGVRTHGGGENIIAWASYKQTPDQLIVQWLASRRGHREWVLCDGAAAGWGQAWSSLDGEWCWAGSFDGTPLAGPPPTRPPTTPPPPRKRPWWQWLFGLGALLGCAVAGGAEPADVVFLYAHRDVSHKQALEAHLSPLVRLGRVRLWSDQRIKPGADWHASVCQALDEAEIAVLVVSADWYASDFCWREMQRAMSLRRVTGLIVLPVVVRPVHAWERLPGGDLQAVVLRDQSDLERSRVAAAIDELVADLER